MVGRDSAFTGTPTGLAIFWLEILELAHSGDDASIAQKLSTLALRPEDLDELFGLGAAAQLWADYARAFASFTAEGARDLAQKIRERRYDDVEVLPLTGVRPESLSSADRSTAESLRTNAEVYTVRIKRSEDPDGIRIDTFVYLDRAWRTALKIGRRRF